VRQKTPPHRHGNGRQSWCKVLHGELLYEQFQDRSRAGLMPWEKNPWEVERSVALRTGDRAFSEDCSEALHRMENASESEVAVSLHLYSPPYTTLSYRDDEGKGPVQTLPVVSHCGPLAPPPAAESWSLLAPNREWDVFTSLQALARLLQEETPLDCDAASTTKMLRRVRLNPLEWRRYVFGLGVHGRASRGVILSDGPRCALVLRFWNAGAEEDGPGVAHEAEPSEWVKVLEGELVERCYTEEGPDTRMLRREAALGPGSVTFYGPGGGPRALARMDGPVSAGPCCSLHLFIPPPPPARLRGLDVCRASSPLKGLRGWPSPSKAALL